MPMLKKLDGYILKKFLSTFFFAILIIAVISCVIDYTQKVDDFVAKKTPFIEIMEYFMYFIPHISALLFPLFIFIACIFFTSSMANKSEIIAILASGVTFKRMLLPYVLGASLLGALFLFANHIIVPFANEQIRVFHVKYIWSKPYTVDNNIHIRLSPNEYVYMRNFDYPKKQATQTTIEYFDGINMTKKITAEQAVYDTLSKEWKLKIVGIREFDGLKETFYRKPEMQLALNLTPDDVLSDDRKKEALTTPQLLAKIEKYKQQGNSLQREYEFELHKRTAQPFAGFILVIIGACLASVKVRGGSGLHLVIGVGISAVYMLMLQMSQTFSINAGVNSLVAVWIPNFIFIIVAIYLYLKRIK